MIRLVNLSLALLLLAGLTLDCWRGRAIDEAEAFDIASTRLRVYAQEEGIPLEEMGKPRVTRPVDGYSSWVFDYTSNGNPRHLVRIYVRRNGTTELNRLIE